MPQAVASSEEWGETQVLRWSWDEKEPPCGSMESLKEHAKGRQGCRAWQEPLGLLVFVVFSSLSCLLFLCLAPTFPARTESHWLSHCFLLTFHGDLTMNPGFTADFATNGSFNALYFHTPSQCDSHPRPPPMSPSSYHQSFFLILLIFLFSFPKSTHQEANRMIHSIAQILHSFIPSQTHSLVRFLPFLSYCLCLI